MIVVGVILSRAGSKGLPDKCVRELLGRPVIAYTFEHVRRSRKLTGVVLTTDSEPAKELARQYGIEIIDRPAELATDTAPVDAAARHAVLEWERRHDQSVDAVALLYGNIPVRGDGLIDRAIEELIRTGADSVRSVAQVTKQHPDWIHRVDADGCMAQFRANSIYRRQELEPLHYHDGAVAVVTRKALFDAARFPENPQTFWGSDRRALVQRAEVSVDIDGPIDLCLAEAVLRSVGAAAPSAGEIRLGGRFVGSRHPIYIVAEAGVNHDGDVEKALRLVDAAASAGADAAKFQLFQADRLVAAAAPAAEYQQRGSGVASQQEMLRRLELSLKEFARIRRRCDERKIDFLVTPFSEEDVRGACDLGPVALKIASTDLTNDRLMAAAASTGLPIIASTGASIEAEIHEAVAAVRFLGAGDRLVLLHCVSRYPTPMSSIHLRAIGTMHRQFGVPCGLSDHTTSTATGGLAVAAGACLLEKHLTLDPTDPGPDHAMSLSPEPFREYVRFARESESAMGPGRLGMTPHEEEVRTVAGRSVVAATFIPAGTTLTEKLLIVKRPGNGIPPAHLERLVGRIACVDIPADIPLTWEMVP